MSEAEQEVERLRNLCRHMLAADVSSTDVQEGKIDAGNQVYLCWWAADLVKGAAEGHTLKGTFADLPPKPKQ